MSAFDGEYPDLDLGSEHTLWFFVWAPGAELNPWAADLPGEPDEPVGAQIRHREGPHRVRPSMIAPWRLGSVVFGTPRGRALAERSPGHATWTLQSLDPLTISPSVRCDCGDHGFIREGRWVRA